MNSLYGLYCFEMESHHSTVSRALITLLCINSIVSKIILHQSHSKWHIFLFGMSHFKWNNSKNENITLFTFFSSLLLYSLHLTHKITVHKISVRKRNAPLRVVGVFMISQAIRRILQTCLLLIHLRYVDHWVVVIYLS